MELMPGYKQTEVGVIPDDWETKTLLELAEGKKELFDDGDWIEAEHITTKGVRLIQTGNIGIGKFIEKDERKYIYEASFVSLRCKELKQGDLLICRLAEPAGRSCVLEDIGEGKVVTSVDVTIFRPPSEMADRSFLTQVFSTSEWFKSVNDRSGGTTHKRISRGALGRLKVQIPPLLEQRAIAKSLLDVDALLATLDQVIAKKRDLKQATMQQLLTGKARLPGFSGKWDVKQIGEFTDCTAGGTPSTLNSAYWGGEIPWMSSGELHLKRVRDVEGRITELGLNSSSTKIIPSHCVLIGLAGQGKTRGTVAINLIELCTNQSIAAIFPNKSFNSEYLFHNLDARYDELRELSTGDGGRGGLNLKIIKSIDIPFPSLEEQDAIASVLSDLDAELAALESRREKTRDIKQAMMQELLTGKTRLV